MLKAIGSQLVDHLRVALSKTGVVVVGDVTCDVNLLCSREHPYRATPTAFREISSDVPPSAGKAGAAGVVARVLRSIGVPIKLYGGVGSDEYGKQVTASVGEEVFQTPPLHGVDTTVKCRYYVEGLKGVYLPYVKVNHDVFPAELPAHFRGELIKSCLASIVDQGKREPLVSAVVIADYGKGIVDGQLITRLNEELRNYMNHPARVEVTLLTRRWRQVYRGKHFTHVFWDASGFWPNSKQASLDTEDILDHAREWFRRLGPCRTLVATGGDRYFYYFRNESFSNPQKPEALQKLPDIPRVLMRKYEINPNRLATDPDYTGFRSVLASIYVGLRAATNNLEDNELEEIHEIHENHFEYAINAAISQLAKIGTELPDGTQLLDGMRGIQNFDKVYEGWLDTKMTTGSLRLALQAATTLIPTDLRTAEKETKFLFEEYNVQERPLLDQLVQLEVRVAQLQTIEKDLGSEVKDLINRIKTRVKDGEEMNAEKRTLLGRIVRNWRGLEKVDREMVVELIRLLREACT